MESKAGSILLLIGGIITLLVALGLLIFSFVILFYSDNVGQTEGDSLLGFIILMIFFILALVVGLLKLYASGMMKDPERTFNGGILALIVGIISGGDLLSIIGGILGIVQGKK